MTLFSRLAPFAAAAVLSLAVTAPVAAQELVVGLSTPVTSLDPHFHNLTPNNNVADHVFEKLVGKDAKEQLKPQLAESWKALDETTWEFRLRKGVKWHDGSDFTADDVIASIKRIPTVPNSPASFATYTRPIADITAADKHTLRIKTLRAHPLLPNDLVAVRIIPARLAAAAKSEEFNSGKLMIGTGPYRFKEYVAGDRVVLERNDAYWGAKPNWKNVTFRPLTAAGPRVAALLAGDVDMIENPPIQDFERIKSSGNTVVQGLSNRVIYIHLDQFAGPGWTTPGVKGTDGKNPFLDKRVREAMSKAINRDAIVERIMGGVASPAGELLPVPLFGTSPDRKPDRFDPEAAKKLLADAGYPNGFELVLGSPNDRYINDEKVAQAVAQMLARIGIKTSVDSMTASTFFTKRNKYEFTAYLAGWGADTNEMSNSIIALIATQDAAPSFGNTNRGRYSNKTVDDLTIKALGTIDDAQREALLRQASKVGMEDYGIIPLHFEVTPWAFKPTLSYAARVDQYTLAFEVKQK